MTSEQDDAQPTADARDEPQDDAPQADGAQSGDRPQTEPEPEPGAGTQAEAQDGSQGEAGPQDDDPQDLPPSYPPQERPISSDDSESSRPARRRPRRGSFLVPFVVILLLVALFKTFVIQYFEIPTGSMESTLVNGDRVAVTMYDSDDIKRGDIIVFRDPDHWLNSIDPTGLRGLIRDGLILIRILPEDSGHHLIKRVIGMPGDRVVSDGRGTVSVNGVVLHETYVKAGVSPSEVAFDVTVPDSMVWVMGDNRSNSADSRAHMDDVHGGFVPLSDVVGVAKSIIWPVSRWDGLGEGEDVFAGVPAPR